MLKINFAKMKLVIYLFLLIFAPPLIPRVSVIHILTCFSMFYMLVKWRTSFKLFYKQKEVKRFIILFSLFIVYVLIRMGYSLVTNPINMDNYITALYKLFMVLIEIPICCCFVIIYCCKKGYSFDELLKLFVWTGLIQVVVGGCMIVSPSFKYAMVSFMQRNNGASIQDIVPWEYNRRYNAISDCMLDMLGWGLGILSAIPLYIKGKKHALYLIAIPFLVLITVSNSTTGIIMFVLVVGIAVLGKIKKISNNKIVLFGASIFIIIGTVIAMKYVVPSTYVWTMNEIKSIMGMKTEKVSSFSKVMSSDFRVFPEDILELFFGTGHTVYRADGYTHSDLGYVNNIWLVGIVGTVFLYGIFLYLYCSCIKTRQKVLVIALALAMYIFELKGMGVCYNPGMVLTMLCMFGIISLEKRRKQP